MTTCYHISNLGSYGRGIRTDLDGYVHLTSDGWLNASMDAAIELTPELAEELAAEAREATAEAESEIAKWRNA